MVSPDFSLRQQLEPSGGPLVGYGEHTLVRSHFQKSAPS